MNDQVQSRTHQKVERHRRFDPYARHEAALVGPEGRVMVRVGVAFFRGAASENEVDGGNLLRKGREVFGAGHPVARSDLVRGHHFLRNPKRALDHGRILNGGGAAPDGMNVDFRSMHGRDASGDGFDALKKEVIGGYILFPGDGEPTEVEVSNFYKSIAEVNIGAFPLRPKDECNRKLLEHFIEGLINTKSQETISRVIPQKGTFVDVGNRVLIGLVGNSVRRGYTQSFLDGTATLYYTGKQFPTTIALQNLHFFIPYIKGQGIRDVYEIVRVRTITAKEAKQTEGYEVPVDDLRLAFELRFCKQLFSDYQKIDTHKLINYTFIDTTFDRIYKE